MCVRGEPNTADSCVVSPTQRTCTLAYLGGCSWKGARSLRKVSTLSALRAHALFVNRQQTVPHQPTKPYCTAGPVPHPGPPVPQDAAPRAPRRRQGLPAAGPQGRGAHRRLGAAHARVAGGRCSPAHSLLGDARGHEPRLEEKAIKSADQTSTPLCGRGLGDKNARCSAAEQAIWACWESTEQTPNPARSCVPPEQDKYERVDDGTPRLLPDQDPAIMERVRKEEAKVGEVIGLACTCTRLAWGSWMFSYGVFPWCFPKV